MLKSTRATTFAVVVTGCIIVSADAARAQAPNVVIQWNQIAQTLFPPAPSHIARSLPMLHVAMFDAINSIEEVYTPYLGSVKGSHGASAEAAAAQAARDVLTALHPAQQATF